MKKSAFAKCSGIYQRSQSISIKKHSPLENKSELKEWCIFYFSLCLSLQSLQQLCSTSLVQNPAGKYLLKVNNKNTKARFEKLTTKTLERGQWRLYCSCVFIVNFEHITYLLAFLLLTSNM